MKDSIYGPPFHLVFLKIKYIYIFIYMYYILYIYLFLHRKVCEDTHQVINKYI